MKKMLIAATVLGVTMLSLMGDTEKVGDYTWTYRINGNTAEIFNQSFRPAISPKPKGYVSIPSTLGGKLVTRIGAYAFYECADLTGTTIGNGVTSIGEYAFSGAYSLTHVTILEGVTRIDNYAFIGCTNLVSVTLPDSMASIGSSCFSSCHDALFDTTTIPGVKLVAGWAAGRAGSVVNLDLTGIRGIIDAAFCRNDDLEGVIIPDTVKSIGHATFLECRGLTNITIPNSVTNVALHAFESCTGLTNVTIGSNVARIGGHAFYNCIRLTNMTIPASVVDIADGNAFEACSGLMSFSVAPENPSYKSDAGLLLTKDGTTLICGVNGDVRIPDGVTSIRARAFWELNNLQSVTIPASVLNIGDYAFRPCKCCTSVTFKGDAPNMGIDVFGYSEGPVRTAYVSRKSTGWGVNIPGSWQGIRIEYQETGEDDVVVDIGGGKQVTVPGAWLSEHSLVVGSADDAVSVLNSMAANGRLSVVECYILGLDPEDPNDDLKIAEFKMKDGKPVVTLNHTKDGSGNSFEDRVKILGKAELGDAEWQEVPPEGNPAHRFFTVDVEMP